MDEAEHFTDLSTVSQMGDYRMRWKGILMIPSSDA